MSDIMDTLKGLLGDNADEKLSGIMQILGQGNSGSGESDEISAPAQNTPETDIGITPEMLISIQKIMTQLNRSRDDDRTKLLNSLKPYMRKERQNTIDNAVKMLGMAQLSELFKGGDINVPFL